MPVTITSATASKVHNLAQRLMIETLLESGLDPDEIIAPAGESDHIMIKFKWAGDVTVNIVQLDENLFVASGVVAKIEAPTIKGLTAELKELLRQKLLDLQAGYTIRLGLDRP